MKKRAKEETRIDGRKDKGTSGDSKEGQRMLKGLPRSGRLQQ
jgi:hypothetical protein